MSTNCTARLGRILLSKINTPRDNFFCFKLDAVQKTTKIEKNVNELSGPPEKCSFLTLSTLLETLYVFGIDAVQKNIKTEKNVNELSGPPEKCSFSYHYQH